MTNYVCSKCKNPDYLCKNWDGTDLGVVLDNTPVECKVENIDDCEFLVEPMPHVDGEGWQ